MISYTRCGCGPGILLADGTVRPPSHPCPTDCLYSPDLAVRCDDSVFAGDSMTVDLTQETNAKQFCEQTPVYSLYDYDRAVFSAADVDAQGEFRGTFLSDVKEPFGWVKFIVRCGMFASMATLRVCVKSRCANKICPPNEICDEQTGNCVPLADIEVT